MWGQQQPQQQYSEQHRLEQQAGGGNIRIWHTMWHILNFYYTRTLALMQWHFYYGPKRRRGLFTAPTVAKQSQSLHLPPFFPSPRDTLVWVAHTILSLRRRDPRSGPSSEWCQFLSCALTVNLDMPRPRFSPSLPLLSIPLSLARFPFSLQHSIHFFLWQITKQFIWGMLIHSGALPECEPRHPMDL